MELGGVLFTGLTMVMLHPKFCNAFSLWIANAEELLPGKGNKEEMYRIFIFLGMVVVIRIKSSDKVVGLRPSLITDACTNLL
jgi:hypothetical protein